MTRPDPTTHVSDATVRIEHNRLANREDLAGQREGWAWAIESLKAFLETGRGVRYAAWEAGKQAPAPGD